MLETELSGRKANPQVTVVVRTLTLQGQDMQCYVNGIINSLGPFVSMYVITSDYLKKLKI